MHKNYLRTIIATGGPIGYINGGGTVMSFCTLPLIIIISYYMPYLYFGYLVILICCSYDIIKKILHNYKEKDPKVIVLDEVIGMSIACYHIPLTWYYLLAAFILFRLFDIFKPLGIHSFESISGAGGIIADDMVAGLYTLIIIHATIYAVG